MGTEARIESTTPRQCTARLRRKRFPLPQPRLVRILVVSALVAAVTLIASSNSEATSPVTIDIAASQHDLTVFGANGGDQLGSSMSVGDVNGDGLADIVVAAPGADRFDTLKLNVGKVYVIYGSVSATDTIDPALGQADVTIIGADTNDRLGESITIGNVNGDGIQDIIIGAPRGDGPANGRTDSGEAYVIFGSGSLAATIDIGASEQDVTILGAEAGDQLGFALSAGDVSGDAVDDIVVSALKGDGPGNSRTDAGEAYIIYGGSLPSSIDIAASEQDVTILGAEAGDQLGPSVVLDLDGGAADIVLAAFGADGPGNSRAEAGEAYVLYGGALPSSIDIAASEQDVTIFGADGGDQLGLAITGGNINGDSFDDLIVGAPLAGGPSNSRPLGGEAYVIFGSASLPSTVDAAASQQDVTIFGRRVGDLLGIGLATGDFNGDGLRDLFAAGSGADGPSNDRFGSGEGYVIYGSVGLSSSIDIAAGDHDVAVLGSTADDQLGGSIASGDVNGDSNDDLILGAVGGDGPSDSRLGAGEAYMVIGGDNDSDGILNTLDECPDEAEDFDGVLDSDGCPELDADGDGLLDESDSCPLEPEDFDGFQDSDGCPDPDNDSDGILDGADSCPNNAEDIDGILDSDGCPETDADGDAILDSFDTCPTDPEDLDGIEDSDGCPETDADEDGFLDGRDVCPTDPEDFDGVEDDDGCPESDGDGDGVVDTSDNCPLEPNAGQADFEGDGIGDVCDDSDFDGFFDFIELFVGAEPLAPCAATPTANDEIAERWLVDLNDDQKVSIVDVLFFKPAFGAVLGDPNYNLRLDLNANGSIGISDILTLKPHFAATCATANLGLTIDDSSDPVVAGDEAGYTWIVDNSGVTDAVNVVLTGTLPVGTNFLSAIPSQGSCGETTGVVTCELATIAGGSSATVMITLGTMSSATGALISTASVVSDVTDFNPANDSDTEITTIATESDLSVSKADDPDPVLAGTNLTYQVTVGNDGPSDAKKVVLTDSLPTEVTFTSAVPSQGSCNQASGVITCSFGTIPAGASATLTITAQADSGISAIITNNASVASSTTDPVSGNNAVAQSTEINQTTISGGTSIFAAGSTGNVVEIELTNLPSTGLGDADITVAFDSAVLNITACDTGDLSGACNPNAPNGPARAAGFAVPAITAEPVVIATLTFDCIGAAGTSALTITLNELMDGTPGDPQPIEAIVENGIVACGP